LAVAVFAAFSLAALTTFILFEKYTRKRILYDKKLISLREKRYSLVVAESGREVFQYDVKTGSIHRDSILYDYFGSDGDIANWREYIASSPAADEENKAILTDMFARVDAGESPLTFDVQLIHPNGTRDWNRFHINTIFADGNIPVTAVVSYFNCTYLHDRELAYHKWQLEVKRLEKEFVARIYWDITSDAVEEAQCDSHPSLACADMGLERWAREYADSRVARDDRQAYCAFFTIDRLLGAFERGVESESIDYRETSSEGEIWLRLTVYLTRHPQTGEVKACFLYQDIDQPKREQLEIVARSEMDSLTGALNREALAARIDKMISENPASTHAMLMIDVDGFKAVNDLLGHDEGDEALREIVRIIKSCLRPDDLVGRIGGDEIMLMLKDIPYDSVIRKKARQLCDLLNFSVRDKVEISVSIGIALYPSDASDYDELYRRADTAMYKAKANGKNGFFFFSGITLDSAAKARAQNPSGEPEYFSSAVNRRVVYLGDSDENAASISSALSPQVDVIVTGDPRRASVYMRSSAKNVCIGIVDFQNIESQLAAIKACRIGADLPQTPLLALVDHGDHRSANDLITAGASDFLQRPVEAQVLRMHLDACAIRYKKDLENYNAKYQSFRREEEDNYSLMMSAIGSAMVVNDVANGLFTYNSHIESLLSGTYDDRPLWSILPGDMVARSTDVNKMKNLVLRLSNNPSASKDEMNVMLKTAAGERHSFRFQALKRQGQDASKMILVFTDINEQTQKINMLTLRSQRDSLTGLYSREAFFEKADELISQKPSGYYSILAIDLDDFKLINEQFGRGEGDRLLKGMAERMARSAHSSGGLVGRVYADNFAVICPSEHISSFYDIIKTPLSGANRHTAFFISSVHIGRCVATQGRTATDIYDRATIARNSVKRRYDKRVADFDEHMLEAGVQAQSMANEMDEALARGQFEVWYQPQYDIRTGEIIAAEALTRWMRPHYGIVAPGEYIPLFEKNGFIYKLDLYVWDIVAKTTGRRIKQGKKVVPVSVNISGFDIRQSDIADVFAETASRHGVDARYMRIELSEKTFTNLPESAMETIKRLRDMGFTLCMDSFGANGTSLSAIKSGIVSAIKLDAGLLKDISNCSRAAGVIDSLVKLAANMDMDVIAKGIESQCQIESLKKAGCDMGQGFGYTKPMAGRDFEELLDG
ncbi:MAG: diguanylate cyclase, partial [Clostridia bacterium]|nr:diguanylate cyclase [Clostridia bacterium]